jgi:hypothetical protein
VFSDRSDVFLEHDLLRRGGTDDLAEPPEVGRPPGGSACVTDILPQEKGVEPKLRGPEIADGIVTPPAQVPKGFIVHRGNGDRGEVARAHQSSPFDGITPVGLDAIPGLLGDQGGRHDPADLAFLGQRAVEPVPAGARLIDKDERLAFGLPLPDEVIEITRACTDVAAGDDCGVVFLGAIGDGHRVFLDIHTEVKRARLAQG